MKVWVHGSEDAKVFKYPESIPEVEKYVADNYDPGSFTCVEVCEGLEKMYTNLKAVLVTFMWIGDHTETNHCVCLAENAGNGCDLIDPTGDQFLYKTTGMKCAAFRKTDFGYISDGYVPLPENALADDVFEDNVFKLTKRYPDARIITVD